MGSKLTLSIIRDFKSLITLKKPSKMEILVRTEYRYKRACQEVRALNVRYMELTSRFRKALCMRMMTEGYHLYMKITIVDGVRQAYREYTKMKAFEIADLRMELFGEDVDVASESEEDE